MVSLDSIFNLHEFKLSSGKENDFIKGWPKCETFAAGEIFMFYYFSFLMVILYIWNVTEIKIPECRIKLLNLHEFKLSSWEVNDFKKGCITNSRAGLFKARLS